MYQKKEYTQRKREREKNCFLSLGKCYCYTSIYLVKSVWCICIKTAQYCILFAWYLQRKKKRNIKGALLARQFRYAIFTILYRSGKKRQCYFMAWCNMYLCNNTKHVILFIVIMCAPSHFSRLFFYPAFPWTKTVTDWSYFILHFLSSLMRFKWSLDTREEIKSIG